MDREKINEIRQNLVLRAQALGKTIEVHAADQIADMKTSARDSIIRALIGGFAAGVVVSIIVTVIAR